MLNVLYDVNETLYGIFSFCPIYYSYFRYGIYFRVLKYGENYIHVCHYYYYVSELLF
jgi:hypothetical protein